MNRSEILRRLDALAHERDGRYDAAVATEAAALIRSLLGSGVPVDKQVVLEEIRQLWLARPTQRFGQLLVGLSPEDDWEDIAVDLGSVSDAALVERIRLLRE